MIRAFCGVPTECTEEQVRKFNALLSKINIKIVFMHSECCLSTVIERTAEEIDSLEAANPTGNNLPLQPNCFYSYMPLEGTPSPIRHPIVKILESKSLKRAITQTVFLNCALPQERDYKDLPIDVYKDIVFKDETTQKEVGWYNLRANIVWMSDIFHFLDSTKNILPTIVNSIVEYQRYGKVQEILTVGADPEFEIISEDGDFVEAHRLFGEMNQEIGYDGHSATGELRPKPDRSPLGLTRNIKRLVRRMNGMPCMQGNKIYVGGGVNVSTGGHIHFGVKGVTQEAKDMLYDLVATPVLAFQSERRSQNERPNWEKGQSGNLREQPHGCEWRPLPSFIVNEEITAAVLSTTYAIIKSWKYYGYKRRSGSPITVEEYRKIPLYSAYKEQIDTFTRLFVDKSEKAVLQQRDLFQEWKIDSVKKEFTVDILTQSTWLSSYFTPVNAKIKKNVKLEIRFNGDLVSTFGIKREHTGDLAKFADDHFLPELQVTEKLPRGQVRQLICLPAGWFHMTGKTKFCEDFKGVLKNLVIQLGGK
uniref:Putative phiEco32-like COOH.NH2 ligase-type 2 n=1 Tax=viral metagenome TaxID=1070528 RepID=A0A6M3IRB3_9ZZZZ